MINQNKVRWLRGGLGDVLLKVGNIKPDEFYIVFSHLKQTADLVSVYTTNFKYINMAKPAGDVPNPVASMVYPPMLIPYESTQKAYNSLSKNKKIIGIHPIGSKMSRDFDINKKRPQKIMSAEFIKTIVATFKNNNTEILLFCAPNEVDLFKDFDVRVIAEPYIWDCIAYVSFCDLVIATDSAIKTFSAVLHIPTIVVMGDYEDKIRDETFINPYKEITPIRFTDIDLVIDKVILKAKELLKI